MRTFTAYVILLLTAINTYAEENHKGVQTFYRMLGSQANGPFVLKTNTVAALDYAERIGSTGMANSGFTEYPFCDGRWSFTFRERWGMFPRFASDVLIDPTRINTFDILLDWVYEPDGCVWGPACKEFGQTFVAQGRELVSIAILVASPKADFHVAVHENNAQGRIIAPAKTFTSGHSMEYGYARWKAGEAPLEKGKTYYIRLWREDGKAWNPYFHGSGDIYKAGHAYLDGQPRLESDLALWIMEEPDDVSRAIVPSQNPDGWIYDTHGVEFIPRTPNIRMITVQVKPVKAFCYHLVGYVWQLEPKRRLLCGPKHQVACARVNTAYEGSFLFGPEELPCVPGNKYYLEFFTVPYKEHQPPVIPQARSGMPKYDLRSFVYGETNPGHQPVIYNVTATPVNQSDLRIHWQLSRSAAVNVEVLQPESHKRIIHLPPTGETETTIKNIPANASCDFRLVAVTENAEPDSFASYSWRTPVYRALLSTRENTHSIWPETPKSFMPLAPPVRSLAIENVEPKKSKPVSIPGGNFERDVNAWKYSTPAIGIISEATAGIQPFSGKKMFGWTHRAGQERKDVFQENNIYRTIATIPGHWYEFSLHAITEVENGPRGDTRVRLAADPTGGEDFKSPNASQWFWTDGKWMPCRHRFQAKSNQATISVHFFRWRDLDRASAYIDNVKLKNLGLNPEN
jgi:hypothetical protein